MECLEQVSLDLAEKLVFEVLLLVPLALDKGFPDLRLVLAQILLEQNLKPQFEFSTDPHDINAVFHLLTQFDKKLVQ